MADARAIDQAFSTPVQNDGDGYGVYMEDSGEVHVIPEFCPEHDRTQGCWCHPRIERYDDILVIHNVAH